MNIQSTLNSVAHTNLTNSSSINKDSALTNAIHSDVIHETYKKCEILEKRFESVEKNFNSFSETNRSITEKLMVISKRYKEAMTHQTNGENEDRNVPETFKNNTQKRLSPSLSVCQLSSISIDTHTSSQNRDESALNALADLDNLDISDSSNIEVEGNINENIVMPSSTTQTTTAPNTTISSQPELVNLFLNNVDDSDLNMNTIDSSPVFGLNSSQTTAHTQTRSSVANKTRITAKNEFHLSKFKTDTSSQMIIDYMIKRGVPTSIINDINVTRLVPKNCNLSTLSFISFKLDASDEVAHIITKLNFWPQTCILKEFIHKSKPVVELSSSDINSNIYADSSINFPKPAPTQRINPTTSSMTVH